MFVLVTLACQTCALADYFHPPNADRPVLTLEAPCPDKTHPIANSGETRTVTCRADERSALRLAFDDRGRVESYVTLIDHRRSGLSQRWDASGTLVEEAEWRDDKLHGVRRVYGHRRVLVLEEHWSDGVREGRYKQVIAPKLSIEGAYVAGKRSGPWHEWHRDRHASGSYRAGRRIGQWRLSFDQPPTLPDYVVSFRDDGAPLDAETTKKYRRTMLVAEGAILALGIYGHYSDRPAIEHGAAAGLVVAGPLIHVVHQPGGLRLAKVREAGTLRLLAPVAAFGLYSLGKFIAAIDCTETEYSPRAGGDACTNWSFDYDKKYNVDLLKLGTALIIIAGDYASAYRSTKTTVREAWPTLAVGPTIGGAELTVGGRF